MAEVSQKQLNDLVLALQPLTETPRARLTETLRRILREKLANAPPVAALLREWAPKLREDADAAALVDHFRRLALTAALLDGMRKASARLPSGGASR